jgi:hypothetical protein
MLVEEYREISDISFNELKKVWKAVKENALLIGEWAAHFLSNNQFRSWKRIDYIGSKNIDLGIKSEDLDIVSKKLENLGYLPINFRFYKIFERSTKKPLEEKAASKLPLFQLFYLYVDVILDKKVKAKTTFFHDPIIGFCFRNRLWVEINDFKVIKPEPLVLTKLRILKDRNEEKRIKDILDCIFVVNFSNFDNSFFKEISSMYKISEKSKKIAVKVLGSREIETELLNLRFDSSEIQSVKTTFLSIL